MPNTTPAGRHKATGAARANAGDYRWNPQQGPQAANYRYTPGQTPDAARSLRPAATVPGGYARHAGPDAQWARAAGERSRRGVRQSEARKALEASAAARGGLLSGGRSRPSNAAPGPRQPGVRQCVEAHDGPKAEQYGRDWGQYQQQWNQGVTGTELGLRTQRRTLQAEAASRLREQVNQVASQQGWTQAQAEAAFREQLAQLSSQQGWNQALAGQQNSLDAGHGGAKWNQQQQKQLASDRCITACWSSTRLSYGQDVAQNQTDYERSQALYRQQLAQHLLPWEQASTLATGGQATRLYGQQGQSATNAISNLLGRWGPHRPGVREPGHSWMNALQNVGSRTQGGLQNNAYSVPLEA